MHGRGLQHLALGSPADRAGDVQARSKLAAARKYEAPELRENSVEAVALVLQDVDLRLRDACLLYTSPSPRDRS